MTLSYQPMKKDLFGNKEKDQNLEETMGLWHVVYIIEESLGFMMQAIMEGKS